MMRIIRVLYISKKNPCIFQNLLQGCKAPAQQVIKMNFSSDALKEKVNEENVIGGKRVTSSKETDVYDAPPNEKREFSYNRIDTQLHTNFLSNNLFQNREAILKLITNITPSNAVLLMKNLCSSRTRPLDILNALSGKLQSKPPNSLIECSAVLYCAAVLNFKDLGLIQKMGEQIIENKSQFISHKLPTNIMRSLGVLKYDNQELLEVLLGSILFHKTETPEDLVTALTTLALVDADTPYKKSLVQLLSNYQEMDYSHPEAYLNFVWSCVLLNELNPEHISRVLSPNFTSKILDCNKHQTTLLKLQNIHGAASSLLKSYDGPLLKENLLGPPSCSKTKQQFLEAVKNGLYYMCPKDGFLKFNVDTEAGFFIDVTCNLSPQGEIVRLKHIDAYQKVGVLLLDYHDFCLGKEKMTGINVFKTRIVEAKDYKALTIPYTEFSISARLSEKIKYFRKKFKNAVETSEN